MADLLDYQLLELKPIPKGVWPAFDLFLQSPEQLTARIVQGRDLPQVCGLFLLISIATATLYGGVMGSTNLLQGAPMELWQKFALIGATALKVPVLFLATLAIVFPPMYVSNAFAGARLSLGQLAAAMLGAVAIASTLLASLATVAAFFSLTTNGYHFMKLLHVVFFIFAGVSSLDFLLSILNHLGQNQGRTTPFHLRIGWLLLYAFVGTQLAWVMRPFIASPNEPFELFRERSGNFYESVQDSVKSFATGKAERPAKTEDTY